MSAQQDFVIAYVSRNQQRKSRYDIDKTLLERGYEPEILEYAWQNINKSPSKSKTKTKPKRSPMSRLFMILLTIWVGSWILQFVQLLPDVFAYLIGGFCPLVFFSVIWYTRIRLDDTLTLAAKILAVPFFLFITCFCVMLRAIVHLLHF